MLVCAGAFGQGQIAYQNNAATRVNQLNAGQALGGTTTVVTSASGVEIQLFYQIDSGGAAPPALNATGALGNWIGLATTGIQGIPGGGIFSGAVQTINSLNIGNTGAGQLVWLDFVGWNNSATATTLAAALGGGSTYFGSANVFAYTTGNPNTLPQPTSPGLITTASPGAFTGLTLNPIPEPTTIALGGLGAASLLLFRRRK